jgi:hypothetical protein
VRESSGRSLDATERARIAASVSFLATILGGAGSNAAAAPSAEPREACRTSYEQGQVARKAGRLHEAQADFRTCSADACASFIRSDCVHWLDDVVRDMPSIVVAARSADGQDLTDARVFVDGELRTETLTGVALDLDPGEHRVRLEARGNAPVQTTFVARVGEKDRRVALTVGAPRVSGGEQVVARRSIPLAAYVTGGVGVAGLGVFATFAILGESLARSLDGSCAPYCTDNQVAPVHTDFRVADIALAVGVLSSAVAAYFFFRDRGPAPKTAGLSVSPAPSGPLLRF